MEKIQAYRASYNETVAPPGGSLSRVVSDCSYGVFLVV
jgi:hypothetical protein